MRPCSSCSAFPFALVGGFWLLYLLGHAVSVASAVGFIALARGGGEFSVIMLLYLRHAWERRLAARRACRCATLHATIEGALRQGAAQGDDRGRDPGRPAADPARAGAAARS